MSKKSNLVEKAIFLGIKLTRKADNSVVETVAQLETLIAEAEKNLTSIDSISPISNQINEGGSIMSNETNSNSSKVVGKSTGTGVFCPKCAEAGYSKELAQNVIDFCAKKFPGKPAACFIHQSAYKVEFKKAAIFNKNINAGNYCSNCGNGLSEKELQYNKEHYMEYPEGLRDRLFCRRCQPNKVISKHLSLNEYLSSNFECYCCSKSLTDSEKEMNYYHHNKFGEGLTDKTLCRHCAPKNVVKLYDANVLEKYSKSNKVAETPAEYKIAPVSTNVTCTCCGGANAPMTDMAIKLSAKATANHPELKGMHLCIVCMMKMGVLPQE